jgi:hypothetical protein|nr:MAG: hypothetical protein [Lake Baikal virophage 15]
MDRADFNERHNTTTHDIRSMFNCDICNKSVRLYNANKHIMSMRHIKNCNKGKCKVDLHNFKVIN